MSTETTGTDADLVTRFLKAWREREDRLLRYAHQHLAGLVPRGERPKTALEAARVLHDLDLWFASEDLSRVEHHQQLYQEIDAGSVRRARDLTPEQQALLHDFLGESDPE